MKRYIVLGVNENPKYLYFLPLVIKLWDKFGWGCFVACAFDDSKFFNLIVKYLDEKLDVAMTTVGGVDGYKSDTVAQVSRIYAAYKMKYYTSSFPFDDEQSNEYLMTSDVDMIPLSDYWKFNDNEITTWGRDLTDYHYPMCYIGMSTNKWCSIVGKDYNSSFWLDWVALNKNKAGSFWASVMMEDLVKFKNIKNIWTLDQDIITKKLLDYGKEKITHINRGTDKRTGYPLGRVDRSNWTLDHPRYVDAHLPHDILTNDESFRKVMQLLHTVWPSTDFKWFVEYTKEFKKLL